MLGLRFPTQMRPTYRRPHRRRQRRGGLSQHRRIGRAARYARRRPPTAPPKSRRPKAGGDLLERGVEWFYRSRIKHPPDPVLALAKERARPTPAGADTAPPGDRLRRRLPGLRRADRRGPADHPDAGSRRNTPPIPRPIRHHLRGRNARRQAVDGTDDRRHRDGDERGRARAPRQDPRRPHRSRTACLRARWRNGSGPTSKRSSRR